MKPLIDWQASALVELRPKIFEPDLAKIFLILTRCCPIYNYLVSEAGKIWPVQEPLVKNPVLIIMRPVLEPKRILVASAQFPIKNLQFFFTDLINLRATIIWQKIMRRLICMIIKSTSYITLFFLTIFPPRKRVSNTLVDNFVII